MNEKNAIMTLIVTNLGPTEDIKGTISRKWSESRVFTRYFEGKYDPFNFGSSF